VKFNVAKVGTHKMKTLFPLLSIIIFISGSTAISTNGIAILVLIIVSVIFTWRIS
jgi:hypothetical protein